MSDTAYLYSDETAHIPAVALSQGAYSACADPRALAFAVRPQGARALRRRTPRKRVLPSASSQVAYEAHTVINALLQRGENMT